MLNMLLSGNVSFSRIVVYILSSLVVVFLTLPIHEFAHGLAATKLGDPTPRYQGRMTINPFAHIDYIGALCIVFFGFGWAKPVGVNQNNFRNPKRDMALTALAGPLANLVVALISLFFYYGFYTLYAKTTAVVLTYIVFFFYYIAQINVYLAVFNLVPIPPLDGSRLLFAFLPSKYYFSFMRYERYIFIALVAILWLGVLDAPLNFLSSGVMGVLQTIASLPFKLFLG